MEQRVELFPLVERVHSAGLQKCVGLLLAMGGRNHPGLPAVVALAHGKSQSGQIDLGARHVEVEKRRRVERRHLDAMPFDRTHQAVGGKSLRGLAQRCRPDAVDRLQLLDSHALAGRPGAGNNVALQRAVAGFRKITCRMFETGLRGQLLPPSFPALVPNIISMLSNKAIRSRHWGPSVRADALAQSLLAVVSGQSGKRSGASAQGIRCATFRRTLGGGPLSPFDPSFAGCGQAGQQKAGLFGNRGRVTEGRPAFTKFTIGRQLTQFIAMLNSLLDGAIPI